MKMRDDNDVKIGNWILISAFRVDKVPGTFVERSFNILTYN